MANQIQRVQYEGNLAGDPDAGFTPSGKPITNFRMGSNRTYKTADGTPVKETTWLKVAAWGKLGEIVKQYCEKGSHVIVEGRLRPNENGAPTVYENKNGIFSANFEITATDIRILKGKSTTEQSTTDSPIAESDDDVPF
jgi:single-strand DNA-binding protein